MMDPISISASVSSLLVVSVRVIKSFHDLHNSYKDAPVLLSSILSECSVVYASLTLLQNLQIASQIPGQARNQVFEAFDTALLGCALTLSVLDRDVQSCLEVGKLPGDTTTVKKFKAIWERNHLEELLSQIRGHQTALTLLLTTVQTQSMSDLKNLINSNQKILQQLAGKARSMWVDRQGTDQVPNTVLGSDDSVFELSSIVTDTRFDFDEEILASATYQRALRVLRVIETTNAEAFLSHTTDSIVTVHEEAESDDIQTMTSPEIFEDLDHLSLEMSPSNGHTAIDGWLKDKQLPISGSISIDAGNQLNPMLVISGSTFEISGNPATSPDTVLAPARGPSPPQSTSSIVSKFRTNFAGSFRSKAEIRRKVVLVGDTYTGKTVLTIRFCKGNYLAHCGPTRFDNYIAYVEVDGRPVELAIWDTSGSEVFDRLRPLCYQDAHIFVLCFRIDWDDSYDNVQEKWISEVLHFCPRAPIILVGTRKDLRDDLETVRELATSGRRPMTFEEGKELSKKIGAYQYLECSSKTGEGVHT